MFNTNQVQTYCNGKRFVCLHRAESNQRAKYLEALFLMPVRQTAIIADLYAKDDVLVLDTPIKELTTHIATLINSTGRL